MTLLPGPPLLERDALLDELAGLLQALQQGQGWDGHAVTLSVKLPSMIRTLQHGILLEGLDLSHGKACASVRALIRKQAWRAIGALPQHHALAEKRQRQRPVGRFTGQGNGPPPEILLHGAKP